METNVSPVTTGAVGVRYGLLTGLVSIIFSFVLFVTGQEGNTGLVMLALVILIAGIVLAHKTFKAANEGYMSYGQGLGIGTLVSGVSGVLTAIFTYVYREFIDPDMTARTIDKMRAKLEAAGNMSDAQINQAISMSMKFSTGLIGLAVGIVSSFVLGLVLSLVIAAITKNAKPEFE